MSREKWPKVLCRGVCTEHWFASGNVWLSNLYETARGSGVQDTTAPGLCVGVRGRNGHHDNHVHDGETHRRKFSSVEISKSRG